MVLVLQAEAVVLQPANRRPCSLVMTSGVKDVLLSNCGYSKSDGTRMISG